MTTCVDSLGPGHLLCPTDHCDEYQGTSNFHRICNCVDWQGNRVPNCDPKDNLYPVQTGECYNPETKEWRSGTSQACAQLGLPWYFATCYCCCSCFAASTPVADPQGFRPIGDYLIGDEVLTAFRTGDSWTWQPATVQYSNGSPATTATGPGVGNLMYLIEYGTKQSVLATPNQLFLLPDGKLRRANQLTPGTDSLVGVNGTPVAIGRISTGFYKGPIHHIATQMVSYGDFSGKIDGHLINTNGVVAGDYLLQVFQDTPKMRANLDQNAPTIGTDAYRQQNPNLVVKPYVVGTEQEVVGAEYATPEFFTLHGDSNQSAPAGALSLFSERQEAMLLDPDIAKRGFSDSTNLHQVSYFTKLFGAFYPDVDIVLDWESVHPNVFGYQDDGKATVLVGGELLRIGALYGPAMAIALGFGVAAASIDESSLGRALYDGVSGVLADVLGPYWIETVHAGLQQFSPVLTALAAKETDQTSDDTGLSADCLLAVIDAAVSGDMVPGCAGGDTLALKGAEYADGTVRATFNTELDPATANVADNYAVSPGGVITGVLLDEKNPTSVSISCELTAGKSYVLTVLNLTSADGSTLNPLARSAAVKASLPQS
jgi:hypothetical protein